MEPGLSFPFRLRTIRKTSTSRHAIGRWSTDSLRAAGGGSAPRARTKSPIAASPPNTSIATPEASLRTDPVSLDRLARR